MAKLKQAFSNSRSLNLSSPPTPFSPPPNRRSARLQPARSAQISPMGREENPRNGEGEELSTTTPMPESATASGPPTNLFSPGSTPFSPYSMNKPVVLYNWWLILLEQSYGGKRLGVEGFCTKGKKSARIFTSTPIIKIHDAYTLEIADGITVIIHGIIDKERSSNNGFPLEVCNRFLIGFPVNWEDCADGNFDKESTSDDSAGYVFSVHIDEFSLSRIHAGLTSMGCSIDNLSGENFIDNMTWFCNHPSVTSTTQMSSDAQIYGLSKMKGCFPERNPSKSVTDKINQHGNNTVRCATSVDHAGGLEAGHAEEVGCHRNDLNENGVLEESSVDVPANFKHNVSLDSNSETDSLYERDMHMQKVTLLEKDNHLVRYVPAESDNVNHTPTLSEAVGDRMNHAEEVLTGKSPWNATDEILLKDNGDGHTTHGDISLHVVHKLNCDRGRRNSPASVTNKSGCLDKNVNFASMESTEIVTGTSTTEVATSAWRMKKLKNKEEGVQAIKSSVEIKSVAVEHKFVNTVDAIKHKHRRSRRILDLLKVGAVNPAPTGETHKQADGHAINRISMNSGDENGGFNCSVECSVEVVSQADVMMEVHPNKDKKQNMSGNKIGRMKKVKNRGEGAQAIKSSMDVKKNGVKSVPVEHNIVNTVDDIKQKHRHNRLIQDLAKVGAVKGTLKLPLRELERDPVPTGETNKQADMHTNIEISINDGGENEDNCFVECLIEVASQSDITMGVHPNKDTKHNTSGNKITKKSNTRDANQFDGLVQVQHVKDTTLHSSCNSRRTVWTPSYSTVYQSPLTRSKAKKLPFASPESLNLRRSRSGRLLVPRLNYWCQQLIYTMDGQIHGISGVETLEYPNLGNMSEPPPMKRRKLW